VKTCFMTTLPMAPELCFDFCRTQGPDYRFFGIEQGSKCYCTTYYTKASKGGTGKCDIPCEAENAKNEMCGGSDMASLFEMHMCADSKKEAEVAAHLAKRAKAELDAQVEYGQKFQAVLKKMSGAWAPGGCSLSKTGTCDYAGRWLDVGNKLNTLLKTSSVRAQEKMGELLTSLDVLVADGQELSAIEKTTKMVDAQARVMNKETEKLVHFVEDAKVGLFSDAEEGDFFLELGETEKDWHAICDLESYNSVLFFSETANSTVAAQRCTRTCMDATRDCMGYNLAQFEGVTACTFLTGEKLTRPGIADAVPLFEISQTKIDAMAFSKVGCFMRKTFMNDSGRGTTKQDVLKRLTNV